MVSRCTNIELVLEYAMELCKSSEKGGRVVVSPDGCSGRLVDCSLWPDDCSQAVLSRFPECNICFLSAQDTSLSGFAIHFSVDDGRTGMGGVWLRMCRRWWPFKGSDTVVIAAGALMVADVVRLVS